MSHYIRIVGISGLATGAFILYIRRQKKRRREQALKRRGNNGNEILNPDDTGAEVQVLRNSQDVELYVRCWREKYPKLPRGVVILIHSYCWHSAYFLELAETLLHRHFAVVAYDLQGHGLSGAIDSHRGDVRRYEDHITDGEKIIELCKRSFGNQPLFVLGEGFGGTIALHLAIRQENNIKGIILSGPLVMTSNNGNPPFHIKPFLSTLEKLMPDLRISTTEGLKSIVYKDSDPLLIHTPTLRFFIQTHQCLMNLEKNLEKVKIPFIALHGSLDQRAPPDHSKELVARTSSTDKKLLIYNNMHSRLFQEAPKYKERVFSDLTSWLEQRSPIDLISDIPTGSTSQNQPMPASTSYGQDLNLRREQQRLLDHLNKNGF